ncbi:MAG: hypothetical protein KJO42_08965 [Silicimonas sp.]|nr:hypothetical protein [Silicimonas sp.]
MIQRILLSLFLAFGGPAKAQDWSEAAMVVTRDLAGGGTALGTTIFPNSPHPAFADRALGIVYVHIEGSAGNSTLEAGLFARGAGGWQMHRRVTGLVGASPRNPQVNSSGFYLTTSTLGPNDPRCCPSVETEWFVDWATGQASER